ncbi:MAG: sensor histidine kinase [Nitrospira sp.]|nr:sensor histidine kinase [Nitrospira sp.]
MITAVQSIEQRIHGLVQDRTRIERDLHDSVLQSLYAIGINLEIARSTEHPHPRNPQRSQDHLVEQLHHVIQEVRGMITSLDSGMIEDFDLSEELVCLQETYQQSGRLRVDLDLQPTAVKALSTKERSELLNITREALSNCARHAEATQVTVAIRSNGTTMCVRITDDGKGFTPTENSGQGYGLRNMRIRARKLGGTLQVRSLLGRGTAISVDFALPLIPTNA